MPDERPEHIFDSCRHSEAQPIPRKEREVNCEYMSQMLRVYVEVHMRQ
jgi:hypothetical protein